MFRVPIDKVALTGPDIVTVPLFTKLPLPPLLPKVRGLVTDISMVPLLVTVLGALKSKPPSCQLMAPLLVILAEMNLLFAVLNVSVLLGPIVRSRPRVPSEKVVLALIVSVPGPVMDPWIVKSLLIVRLPAPAMVFVLEKIRVEGNTTFVFKLNVPPFPKLPVPDTVDPAFQSRVPLLVKVAVENIIDPLLVKAVVAVTDPALK